MYDALAESVQLLDGELEPADTARLSRRVRHLPLAVDRRGDIGATLFLRRGVSGAPSLDLHTLERREGAWRLLGGGSGEGLDESDLHRPTLTETRVALVRDGGAGTARNADRPFPWPARWVRCAQLRAAAEVAAVRVEERVLRVADHGFVVVVWPDRKAPLVTAVDRDGHPLGTIRVGRDRP